MVCNLGLMCGLVYCCVCIVGFYFWVYWWIKVLTSLVVSCVGACALFVCFSLDGDGSSTCLV